MAANPRMESGRRFRHVLYASGNFAKSSLGSFVELYALFYLTDILGLPAAVAGAVLFMSLVWDGVTDPLMGLAADRLRQKFPTVRIYFLLGAPITALAFIGLFQADAIAPSYVIFYIFAALILFRTAYTVVDIPHNSMLSFLSRDSRDRTNIASLRIFFSAAGKLAVTVGVAAIFKNVSMTSLQAGFSTASCLFAFVYLVVISLSLLSIWNIHLHGSGDGEPIRLTRLMRRIRQNSHLRIVFYLTAVTSLTTPVIGSAIVYYGKYAMDNEQLGATALIIMSAAQAVSLLFWSKLSNRMRRKKSAAQSANALLAIAMLLAILTLNGHQALYGVAALAGFAIGGIFMLNWSMLPDALDEGPDLSSHHYNMSIFGLYTLTNKGFIGLSQALFGLTLTLYGYQADSAMASETIGVIVATLLAFPFFGAIACMVILRNHMQIQSHHR